MRVLIAVLAVLGLGCSATGPCCTNQDCPGSNICNVYCPTNGNVKGSCTYKCQVDADCGANEVCNVFSLQEFCGCEAATSSAQQGNCSPNVGH